MKILLTGSEGFIGKSVYQKLLTIDDVTNVTCLEKDYMNHIGWESTLSKCVGDSNHIIHIGAISDTMLQDNNEMMKYNYEFSKVLFDLAKIWDKPVIYASSAANDGDNGLPSNFYGWSKYITEQYGLNVVDKFYALRYFNVYGPGEEHKGKMSSVAYQAWKKGSFKLFDGKPQRDFVYVDDVVNATLIPIFKKCRSGIYHVGTGEARTFEDVLTLMDIPFEYWNKNKTPNGYQYHTQAEPKMMLPAWIPTKLEDGIKKYKQYLEGR